MVGATQTSLIACEQSAALVAHARAKVEHPGATFEVVSADALPSRAGGFDF